MMTVEIKWSKDTVHGALLAVTRLGTLRSQDERLHNFMWCREDGMKVKGVEASLL